MASMKPRGDDVPLPLEEKRNIKDVKLAVTALSQVIYRETRKQSGPFIISALLSWFSLD